MEEFNRLLKILALPLIRGTLKQKLRVRQVKVAVLTRRVIVKWDTIQISTPSNVTEIYQAGSYPNKRKLITMLIRFTNSRDCKELLLHQAVTQVLISSVKRNKAYDTTMNYKTTTKLLNNSLIRQLINKRKAWQDKTLNNFKIALRESLGLWWREYPWNMGTLIQWKVTT